MRQAKPENALGQQLRARRRALGLSQREAAAKCGLSDPYLCQLERGRVKTPSLDACIAIASAYGLTLEEIAGWTKQPHAERLVCEHCGQEID